MGINKMIPISPLIAVEWDRPRLVSILLLCLRYISYSSSKFDRRYWYRISNQWQLWYSDTWSNKRYTYNRSTSILTEEAITYRMSDSNWMCRLFVYKCKYKYIEYDYHFINLKASHLIMIHFYDYDWNNSRQILIWNYCLAHDHNSN